jgi:hypothetical protein
MFNMLKKQLINTYTARYKYFKSSIIYVQNWRECELLKCIPALVHILKYFCNYYLLEKIHSKSASLEPETRSTIAVTWNDLVSKYLNSNFGKFQVRLSYLLFGAKLEFKFLWLYYFCICFKCSIYSNSVQNCRLSGELDTFLEIRQHGQIYFTLVTSKPFQSRFVNLFL